MAATVSEADGGKSILSKSEAVKRGTKSTRGGKSSECKIFKFQSCSRYHRYLPEGRIFACDNGECSCNHSMPVATELLRRGSSSASVDESARRLGAEITLEMKLGSAGKGKLVSVSGAPLKLVLLVLRFSVQWPSTRERVFLAS